MADGNKLRVAVLLTGQADVIRSAGENLPQSASLRHTQSPYLAAAEIISGAEVAAIDLRYLSSNSLPLLNICRKSGCEILVFSTPALGVSHHDLAGARITTADNIANDINKIIGNPNAAPRETATQPAQENKPTITQTKPADTPIPTPAKPAKDIEYSQHAVPANLLTPAELAALLEDGI